MTKTKIAIHEKVLFKLFTDSTRLIFFDIGACEGLSSVRYQSLFPKSSIYAFEPVPKNFELVKENENKYLLKNFYPNQFGLSNKKDTATFYLSSGKPENKEVPDDNSVDFGNKSSSLYEPNKTKEVHPWLKFEETMTINIDTLDNFCEESKIETIDFIHMDVQGAELMVLEGSKKMLPKIKSIWLEVECIELYKNQALKKDIEAFLSENNFICVVNKVNYVAGDQFWVNKDYFNSLHASTKSDLKSIRNKTNLKSKLSTAFGGIKYNLKKVFK